MIYLSGCHRPDLSPVLGLIVQPGNSLHLKVGSYHWWAADTGCYAQGDGFDTEAWIRWLGDISPDRCLFATAPDVVGNMRSTLERSQPWLARIRHLGFPAALVAQDGAEPDRLPWGEFDVLFIGGTTTWKLSPSALAVAAAARAHGIPVHMGRVNSLRRMQAAALMGCTSVDGTYIAHRARQNGGDRGLREVVQWLGRLEGEPFLPLGVGASRGPEVS